MVEPTIITASGFEVSGPPPTAGVSGSPSQNDCEQGCLDRDSCQFIVYISAPSVSCLLYDTALSEYTPVANANAVIREKQATETGRFSYATIKYIVTCFTVFLCNLMYLDP